MKMEEQEVKERAAREAMRRVPTEHGFFDGEARLAVFLDTAAKLGLVLSFGGLLTDEQLEAELERWGLDV